MTLHRLLDFDFGEDGEAALRRMLGGAEERQEAYVAQVRMLLAAGSGLHYPGDPDGDGYRQRLLRDASPAVRRILEDGAPP